MTTNKHTHAADWHPLEDWSTVEPNAHEVRRTDVLGDVTITRQGVFGELRGHRHVDSAGGVSIGDCWSGTWEFRDAPTTPLPTTDCARIIPAPGHPTITAEAGGRTYSTTVAVYNARRDYWVADWREDDPDGGEAMQTMPGDAITARTWQADQ